jgi:DNA-binding IclR family transcriptional regulator
VAIDDGEYAVGVCCLAAAVPTSGGPGAVAVVSAPSELHRAGVRRTLHTGAERIARALELGRGAA